MNTLIWIAPLYFSNNPYASKSMANFFGVKFADMLKNQFNADVKFVLNEALTQAFEQHNKYDVITIDHFEMVKPLNLSSKDLSRQWYRNTYSDLVLSQYESLIKSKLNGFQPELIFSFTPVSFLRRIFPDALVITFETVLYSRNPFPLTLYLDPFGNLGDMGVCRFEKELKSYQIGKREKVLVNNLKKSVQAIMNEKTPFKSVFNSYKEKFDHLVLLPLEIEDHFVFRALCDFNSQFDYLTYVLDRVPSNVGVIVTTHPMNDVLNEGMVQFLKNKYPSFIYDASLKEYQNSSQFLFNDVDAIIVVATTLAVQALLWDKKVFSLGEKAYDFVADSTTLDNMREVLDSPTEDKDNILYWLLTHYAISDFYMFDEKWFASRIKRMLEYKNTHKQIEFDFFESIDDDETIIHRVINSLKPDSIPEFSASRNIIIEKQKTNTILDMYKSQMRNMKLKLLQLLKDKNLNICCYGGGIFAAEFLREIEDNSIISLTQIKAIFDKSKYKEIDNLCGVKMLSCNDIKEIKPDIIIITMENENIVRPFLEEYKKENNLNYEIF